MLNMIDTTVPIFSFSELQEGLHKEKFHKCLSEQGVFYLTQYGMSDTDHHPAKTSVMDLFSNSTEEEKAEIMTQTAGIRRGYSKLEAESTAQVINAGKYTDYSMCYSMGISDNLFPSEEFKQMWVQYFAQLYQVAKKTAKEALSVVGAYPIGDIDSFLDCDPVLRFRYFPEVPEDRCAEFQPNRMAPHYDLSIVTLIHQTPCPNGFISLQYKTGDIFVDLPPLPNALIIICGAVATLVSNGKIKAPTHRVLAPTLAQRVGSDRTSSVFFLRPNHDFTFSLPLAKACGFDTNLTGEKATFKQWIGTNYVEMMAYKE
jgi:deacetoxycephalosporin-C synthase